MVLSVKGVEKGQESAFPIGTNLERDRIVLSMQLILASGLAGLVFWQYRVHLRS